MWDAREDQIVIVIQMAASSGKANASRDQMTDLMTLQTLWENTVEINDQPHRRLGQNILGRTNGNIVNF